jgi:hypothetical protein
MHEVHDIIAKAVVVLALQRPLLSYDGPGNTGGDAANVSPGGTRGFGEHNGEEAGTEA